VNLIKKILSIIAVLIAFSAALFASYSILSQFFEMSGAIMFIFTGIGALVLLFVVFGAIMSLLRRSQLHNINDMHDKLTHTLNEISNGNFNVFIELDDHSPHSDIAEAMNEMTRKLGTLESMRQDFISNVSHEIQSPLTSIGGFAKLLKDESLPPEQRKHYAEIIETESKRLSGLSENLLKLTSLDNNKIPLNKTDFRLDKQLQQIALTLEPQWSAKNITFEADLQKTTINADAELLSQVWINLLNNAIKFTPNNGTIQLTINNEQITISDTGCGISDDDKLHIFERFYKVDKARDRSLGGNGLGLAIVKKIVELHGFSIIVNSKLGEGTKFTINL
jgi:signal transduction histidine kinase